MNAETAVTGKSAPEAAVDVSEERLAEILAQEEAEANGKAESGKQTAETEAEAEAGETANAEDESRSAETEESESEAEAPAEEAETAEDLSQADEESTEQEAGSEEQADETAPKPPGLKDILDTVEGLKDEHREAIAERMNQIVVDRVGKVKAKHATELQAERDLRSAAEAKAAELEQQQASAPATVAAAGENPYASISSETLLQQEQVKARQTLQEAKALERQLKLNPKAVEARLKALKVELTDPATGEADYSRERMEVWVSDAKDWAEAALQEHLPARAQQIQRQREFEAEALKSFPALKEPQSPLSKGVAELMKRMPHIARLPEGKLLLAHVARDVMNVAAQLKAKAAPKQPPLAPAKQAKAKVQLPPKAAAGRPKAVEGARPADLVAAEKKFAESGSLKDLEALEAVEARYANQRRK